MNDRLQGVLIGVGFVHTFGNLEGYNVEEIAQEISNNYNCIHPDLQRQFQQGETTTDPTTVSAYQVELKDISISYKQTTVKYIAGVCPICKTIYFRISN